MDLQARADDIPGEIAAADVDVARVDLDAAWTRAETAHAHERDCARDLEDARTRLAAANRELTSTTVPTADAVLTRRENMDRLRLAAEQARLTWRAARDIEGDALVDVERLEHRVADLTGQPPPDGTGLRARPRPLAHSVAVGDDLAGAQAADVNEYGSSTRVYPAGSVPPRWLAGRLGRHVYQPAPEPDPPGPPPAPPTHRWHVDDRARPLGPPHRPTRSVTSWIVGHGG